MDIREILQGIEDKLEIDSDFFFYGRIGIQIPIL